MEKKLKTINYELEQTEKRLEDLLAGIKQLRKEVHEILPPEVKKVMHERVVLNKNNFDDYINLDNYLHLTHEHIKIKNYILYASKNVGKFTFYHTTHMLLSVSTVKKEIILTYIPSENLVIVVER